MGLLQSDKYYDFIDEHRREYIINKEVNLMTKEEQLKKAFKMLLTTMLEASKEECFIGDLIDSYANLLIKEVTIRVKL